MQHPLVHNVSLAKSVKSLSFCLINLDREDDALIILAEAVDIFRALSDERLRVQTLSNDFSRHAGYSVGESRVRLCSSFTGGI